MGILVECPACKLRGGLKGKSVNVVTMSRKQTLRIIGLSTIWMVYVQENGLEEVNMLLRTVYEKSRRPKLKEGISAKIRILLLL